jgi:hypothetical protein
MTRQLLLSLATCVLLAACGSSGGGGGGTDTEYPDNGLDPGTMVLERPPLDGRLPADLIPPY